jgi:hypothetical protein
MARILGNALHQLQAFVQPHVKHVITQTFEQADEEDLGPKSDTEAHLLRQAVKIQRGDEIDQITALVSDPNSNPELTDSSDSSSSAKWHKVRWVLGTDEK